ncbi:MoxR family ATPase [Candidatus Micrarchaeota archaeon]|nr:MoxR family ATPase [Candidatus Micrarchaeota archaeon]
MAVEASEEISKKEVATYHAKIKDARSEMGRILVGQTAAIDCVFRGLLADGHILIEGVPGIAKTLLMLSLAAVNGCKSKRIQFTPDMLPSDIVGITTYTPEVGFSVVKGPIFTNFVLADEINRAPPKVQSALLEAMQERKTTIGKETYSMERPFLVLATQNTIESIGVYALPAAQIDRFLFKFTMGYPTVEEEKKILKQNITIKRFDDYDLKQPIKTSDVFEMQKAVHKIYLSDEIEDYIVHIVDASRHSKKYDIERGRYIDYGGSPRASIGLFIASKTNAFMKGRNYVTPEDVKEVAHDVMRHRIMLNYEGQAENINVDDIITEIISKVPVV